MLRNWLVTVQAGGKLIVWTPGCNAARAEACAKVPALVVPAESREAAAPVQGEQTAQAVLQQVLGLQLEDAADVQQMCLSAVPQQCAAQALARESRVLQIRLLLRDGRIVTIVTPHAVQASGHTGAS